MCTLLLLHELCRISEIYQRLQKYTQPVSAEAAILVLSRNAVSIGFE